MNTDLLRQPSTKEKFWKWVKRGNSKICWEWTGCQIKGYGIFCFRQVLFTAHRVAYMYNHQIFNLTKWDMVMHTCENKICCNPTHLYLMAAAERHKKMVDDGVSNIRRGEKNIAAKLNREQVKTIREIYAEGKKVKDIAHEYGVSVAEVRNIINGYCWGWLNEYTGKKLT